MAKPSTELKKAIPGDHLEELAAGIDEVDILFVLVGEGAAVEDAALAVVEDDAVLGDEVGNQGGDADAEVDVAAVGQFPGDPHGDYFPVKPLFVFEHGGRLRFGSL